MQGPPQGSSEKAVKGGSFIRKNINKEQHLSWVVPKEDGDGSQPNIRRLHQQERPPSSLHQVSSTTPRDKGVGSGDEKSSTTPRSEAKGDSVPAPRRPPSAVFKNVASSSKPSPSVARRPLSVMGAQLPTGGRTLSGSTIIPREKVFDCPLEDDLKLLSDFKEQERKGAYSVFSATAPYQFIGDQDKGLAYPSDFGEGEKEVHDVIDLDRITKLSDDLAKNYKRWFQEMSMKIDTKKTIDRKRRFAKDYTPRKDIVHKGGREGKKEKSGGNRRTVPNRKEQKGKEKEKEKRLKDSGKEEKDKHKDKIVKDKDKGGREKDKETEEEDEKPKRIGGGGKEKETNNSNMRENSRIDGNTPKGSPPVGSNLLSGSKKLRGSSARTGGADVHEDRGGGSGGSGEKEKEEKDKGGGGGGGGEGEHSSIKKNLKTRNGETSSSSSLNGGDGVGACNGNGELSSNKEKKGDEGEGGAGGVLGDSVGDKKGKIKGKKG